MAAPDDSALKALIDSNIPDATPTQQRRAKASFVRFVLYQLIDWVKTAINGNLSTWYKVGTTSTPATNAEDIYRMGRVFVGKSTDDGSGAALQADTFSLYGVQFLGATALLPTETLDFDTLTKVGTYCIGGSSWGAGLHSPGNAFTGVFTFGTLVVNRSSIGSVLQQFSDNGTNYIYHRTKWGGNAWGAWFCASRPTDLAINNTLQFDATVTNRKISLYGAGSSDHQFYGFGVNDGKLQYRIDSTGATHAFYAGLTPATSQELMRIQGNGNVGIGIAAPTERLHVLGNALIQGEVQAGSLAAPTSVRTYGYFINYFASAFRAFRIGGATTTTGLTLKTTQYVSIEIDGTIYKLALVN